MIIFARMTAFVPQGVGSMRQAHAGYVNGDVPINGPSALNSEDDTNPGLIPGTEPKHGTEISPTADLPEYPLYSGAPPSHYFPFRTGLSLGIPVAERLKLTTGFEPDVCISATYADKRIDGDKLSFSLLAAGGVQFNITKWLGLYVEPELSWTAPSKNRKLETYRTVYPVMFSVSTGLRFNL